MVANKVPEVGKVTDVLPVNVPVKVCAPENVTEPPKVMVDVEALLIPVPPFWGTNGVLVLALMALFTVDIHNPYTKK